MLSFTTYQTIIQLFRMIADISILWVLLFYTIKIVRNNSRTAQIFKGIILILIIRAIANFFGFKAVDWLAGVLVTWGFLAIIIIFQPEIRTILERLGKSSVFSRLSTLSGNERSKLVDELVTATMQLSHNKVGGLITIEQGHSLNDFIKTGTPMNSLVTADLLMTIFLPNTPLHDGAVIIQGDRIACASAYFPPTNLIVPTRFGARHRAAIGISEITDSVTIVVSEKSGRVSIAEEGKLIPMTQAELKAYLEQIILYDESEIHHIDSSKAIVPTAKGETKASQTKDKLPASEPFIDPDAEEETDAFQPEPTEPEAKSEDAVPSDPDNMTSDTISDENKPEIDLPVEMPSELKQMEPEAVVETPRTKKKAVKFEPSENLFSQEPFVEKQEDELEPVVETTTPAPKKPSFLSGLFKRPVKKASPEKKAVSAPQVKEDTSQKDSQHIKLEYSVSDESLLDDDFSDDSSKGGE